MKYQISSDYLREGPPRWDIERRAACDARRRIQGDGRSRAGSAETVERWTSPSGNSRSAAAGRETAARCSRQADTPPGLDDARTPVRARRHAVDRAAVLRRLQLLADGHQRRLGRDVEDQHAAGRASAIFSRHWFGRRTAPWSPTCGTTGRHPSVCTSADRAIAATRGARSRIRRCRIPAPVRKCTALANGHWLLVYNDLEQGRYSLAVSLSEDEGATWPWTRHLERDPPGCRSRERRASITTRRSSRPGTARCTRATVISCRRPGEEGRGGRA